MIRVVLDANVFVSAVLTSSGNPSRIIDMLREGKIKLLISPAILAEVKTALLYPKLVKLHGRSKRWIDGFLRELSAIAEITPGDLLVDAIKDDPSDNIYLACAVEGKADFIVSGDKHLRQLGSFRDIPILEPVRFVDLISYG